jgi:hypothetical protein
MKQQDIQGLSGEQIAQKFSLPQVPNTVSKVTIPAGQEMQASVANNILQGKVNGGGGVQFEIKMPASEKVDSTWFTNPKPLK